MSTGLDGGHYDLIARAFRISTDRNSVSIVPHTILTIGLDSWSHNGVEGRASFTGSIST